MKKIIPLVSLALLLVVAAAGYGNSKDYWLWNRAGTYEKKAKCLLMIKGYLGAVETLKMLMVSPPRSSLKIAGECLLEQIPAICMEDFAKMVMLQIELFYMQGKFHEADFSTVFAAAVVEIAKEAKRQW